MDVDTGVVKENKKDNFRVFALINLLKCSAKYISTKTLKSIKDDYLPFINVLIDEKIIEIEKERIGTSSTMYRLNEIYHGYTEHTFTEIEAKLTKIRFIKASNRGKKSSTAGYIQINIEKSEFIRLYDDEQIRRSTIIGYKKNDNEQSLEDQWKTICKINKTGRIDPRQHKDRRLYSRITGLSSFIHPYITINGKHIVELDLHATYWMLLPNVLELNKAVLKTVSYIEVNSEIDSFKSFLRNCDNVYEYIGKCINESKDNVKQASMTFICETQEHMSGIPLKIKEWFIKDYPNMYEILMKLRSNVAMSYRLQSFEASLFVNTAKKLNEEGIDVLTKHDSLMCYEDNVSYVSSLLTNRFSISNVVYRVRIKRNNGIRNIDGGYVAESDSTHLKYPPKNEERSDEVSVANITKGVTMKTRDDIRVRLINNNGSKTWIYEGVKPSIKRSLKKYNDTESSFKDYVLSKINNPPKNDVVENTNPPKNDVSPDTKSKPRFAFTMPKINLKSRSIRLNNDMRKADLLDIFSYEEE